MKTIYLHVGLPKTATTTMQYLIFNTPPNDSLYLGKYEGEVGSMQNMLNRMFEQNASVEETRRMIAPLLAGPGPFLYSNEMLTVDTTKTWRQKLKELSAVFEHMRVETIVTTRRASEHAYSLYAELKVTGGWRDFSSFLQSSQAEILDPTLVRRAILDAGLAKLGSVWMIDFDCLVAAEFQPLTKAIPPLILPEAVGELNSRCKTDDGAISSRTMTLYDAIYGVGRRTGVSQFIPSGLRSSLGRIARSLPGGWQLTIERTADPRIKRLNKIYASFYAKAPSVSFDLT